MSRGNTWTNSDGLVVGYGTHSEDNNVSAVHAGANGVRTITAEYTLVDLSDTFAATNVNPQDARIPRGSVIQSAYIHTLVTPTTGSTSTLDIGLWGVGLATEVVDVADGIIADASITEMDIIGSVIQCDGAYIADSATAASTQYAVGAVSESDCVLAPSYETAVFTAGKVRVVVNFIPPSGSSGRTLAAVD
jgi:hypothetical protein